MREIVVLSGKGGTGKTSITAAFATLAVSTVVADCDVDAADLHLILRPEAMETHDFTGGKTVQIDLDACVRCGHCVEMCRFAAIAHVSDGSAPVIDEYACEGCGVCAAFCPSGAIRMVESLNGRWFKSHTRVGPMLHARLRPGGENSGKLVALIRSEAKAAAERSGLGLILTDGPPGIGCPVIASLAGASLVVIVTEPTVSGIHDLERVAGLAAHFKVPAGIIINKCDINADKSREIRDFGHSRGLETFGQLPYDPAVTKAQLAGQAIPDYCRGQVAVELRRIWGRLSETEALQTNKGANKDADSITHI